ncbi:MAG TPA: enoyl-CoA hydratase-related protein, partial [Alphaproteobacteria bacterium]
MQPDPRAGEGGEALVLTEIDGRVGILTFNRPHVLNAFDAPFIEAVGEAMAAFSTDPTIHAIVVRGQGRAF